MFFQQVTLPMAMHALMAWARSSPPSVLVKPSALNAIAGAYSEFVPIVHIVGQPTTQSQKDGMLLHHTLGNGDFNVFTKISAGISCATLPSSMTPITQPLLSTVQFVNVGSAVVPSMLHCLPT